MIWLAVILIPIILFKIIVFITNFKGRNTDPYKVGDIASDYRRAEGYDTKLERILLGADVK